MVLNRSLLYFLRHIFVCDIIAGGNTEKIRMHRFFVKKKTNIPKVFKSNLMVWGNTITIRWLKTICAWNVEGGRGQGDSCVPPLPKKKMNVFGQKIDMIWVKP